jgi:hypothetical protein
MPPRQVEPYILVCYTWRKGNACCIFCLRETNETGNKRLLCKIKRVDYESEVFKCDHGEKENENMHV